VNPIPRPYLYGGLLTLGFIVGFGTDYGCHRPKPLEADKPAPGALLPGGGHLVQVAPSAVPIAPKEPAEGHVVRRETVRIQPKPVVVALPEIPAGQPWPKTITATPPPITVTLDFVRQPNGHLRAVAYSSDGEIVASLDEPVATEPIIAPAPAPRPRLWSAGPLVIAPQGRFHGAEYGLVAGRQFGPFQIDLGATTAKTVLFSARFRF